MPYTVVTSGQTTSNVVLNDGDVQQVTQAGSAVGTVINSGGEQDIFGRRGVFGVADGTVVNDGGFVDVSGAVATNLTVNSGGSALLENYASVTSTVVSGSGGVLTATAGTNMSGLSVAGGGTASFEGARISAVDVQSGGTFTLSSGAATSVAVDDAGLFIAEAAATSVTISSGSVTSVLGGGALASTVVLSGGYLWNGPGGGDTGTVISSGGTEIVSRGAATNPVVQGGALLVAESGGTVLAATINSAGLAVASSGGSIGGTVYRGGELRVSSGGFSVNAVVSSGVENVLSGGVASGTNLWVRGTLNVQDGGIADTATGVFFGTINVSSGGTASSTFVQSASVLNASAGSLLVSAGTLYGGTANVWGNSTDGRVLGGSFNLSSGGVATGTVVLGGGLNLRSGATASTTLIQGGGETIEAGASETLAIIQSGSQDVYGIATSTTISGGQQTIHSEADYDLVSGGAVTVASGGLALSATISSGAMTVYGSASDTLLLGGTATISSGGVSLDATVSGGLLGVYGSAQGTRMSAGSAVIGSGGVSTSATLTGGSEHVLSGGASNQETLAGAASQTVDAGGSTDTVALGSGTTQILYGSSLSTTIGSGASQTVFGSSTDTVVLGGQVVSSGGVSLDATLSGGVVSVGNGGTTSNAQIVQGIEIVYGGGLDRGSDILSGAVVSAAGGLVSSATVGSGGTLVAAGGGRANGATVAAGGMLNLGAGGLASATVLSGTEVVGGGGVDTGAAISGGTMSVTSGGVANGDTIFDGGTQLVLGAGLASGTVVSSGGVQGAASSGTTSGTVVRDGGSETVASGGRAALSVVSAGGTLTVQSGGLATDVLLSSGGGIVNHGTTSAANGTAVTGSGGAASIYNDGLIIGTGVTSGYGISVQGGTVTNAGTITGLNGTAIAFGGTTSNRLIVVSGSVISGQVSATSSASNTLELSGIGGGGTFASSTSQYLGFQTLQVDTGGTWQITGSSTFGTADNLGTIVVGTGDTLAVGSGTGSGSYVVSGQGTLVFSGGVDAGGTVLLDGVGDELVLASPSSFSGTIADFSRDDAVDFSLVPFSGSTATLVGNVITVENGGSTYTLDLAAAITDSALHLSADANGKLLLTLVPLVTEALAADTGASSSDRITASATVAGQVDPNGTVVLTSGGTVLGSATADNGGHWSYTPTLADGVQTISATQTDPGGHTGQAVLTFTLDTTAPDAPTLALTSGSDSAVTGDGITSVATPTLTGSGETGTLVTLLDGSTVIGTATVVAGGWSIPLGTALTDGVHALTAIDSDTAGNASSATLSITVDTTAPATPVIALAAASDGGVPGDGITNVTSPAISGSGGGEGDLMQLYSGATLIGSATVQSGGGYSITPTSALAEGTYSLTVTETDAAGNVSSPSATLSLTIDTTADAAPTGLALLPADDSGVQGDALTSIDQPHITGSGTAGDTVALYDGATLIGSGTVDGGGTFSIAPTSALADGVHSITALQTDPAGNASSASTAFSLTVGATAPAAPSPALATADDSGVPGDGITNVNQPHITGSGTAGDTIKLYEGATLLGSGTVGSGGTFSITPSAALGDGVHDLTLTATDQAANTSDPSSVLALTIDTTSHPQPTGLVLDPASDSGTAGDDITNVTMPAITGSGTAGDTVTLYDGATAVGTALVASGGTFSVAPGTALADGAHSFTVTQTDPAGNVSSASAALAVTIDTTPPGATSVPVLDPADDSGVASDDVTNVAQPAFTGSGTAGETVTLYDGGVAIGTALVDGTGSYAVTPNAALADGVHSLTTTQTDSVGNTSVPSAALSLTIDTTAPAVPVPVLAAASDSGISSTDRITNVTTPVIGGTGTAGDTITLYEGSTLLGTGTVSGAGTYAITLASPLGTGVHSLQATATDPAGNVSARSSALAITIDTTADPAPTLLALALASDSGVPGDGVTNATRPAITGRGVAGHTVTLYDGSTEVGTATVGSNGRFSVAPAAALTDGAHGFTVKQTDPAGNVSAASQPLTVTIDTVPDAAPGGLTLDAGDDSGVAGDDLTNVVDPTIDGTGVAGDTVTLYDGTTQIGTGVVGSDGSFAVVAGTPLSEGAHTLSVRQTDAVGNLSGAATPITVTIDTTAPAVPTPLLSPASDSATLGDRITNVAQPALTGTGTAGDTITLYDGVTAIGSAVVALDGSFSVTPTAALANGTHSLRLTATDPAGNASNLSQPLLLTVDTVADAAPTVLALAPASDTGLSGDDLTGVTTPAITGVGVTGHAVALYDGATLIGTATVGGNGKFSVIPTSALGEGAHSLTAIQTDPAGNVSAASLPLVLTIDTTADAAPAGLTLDPGSDSATPGDALTNVTQPLITGTGTAGDTVTLYNDTTAIGTATVAGDGTFGVTPSVTLTDGPHVLFARQTDAAGNASAASPVLGFTVDTTAPAIPSPVLSPASDSGTPGDGVTRVVRPTITGTETAGDTVRLYDAATLIGSAVVAVDGTFAITPAAALGNGTHSLALTATDPAGNVSNRSAALALTVDTLADAAPSLALAAASDTGTPGDRITSITHPVITGTGATGSTVTLYDGASAIGSALVGLDGTFSITPAAALGNGVHGLTATQADPAGNVSPASAALSITIDAIVPDPTSTPIIAPVSDSSHGAGFTNVSTPTLRGTGTAGDTVTLYDGGVAVGTGTVGTDGSFSVAPAAALPDGLHSFTTTQTNAGGTESAASAAVSITVDTVAPSAPSPQLAAASDTGTSDSDRVTGATLPAITGTGSAGDTVSLYDGASLVGTANVAGDGSFAATPATAVSDGVHSFTVTETDLAGNVSAQSGPLLVTVDTAAPAAPAILGLAAASDSGVAGDGITNVAAPTLTGTAEPGSVVTLAGSIGGVPHGFGHAVVDGSGHWSFTPVAPVPSGTYALTATATDAAGNVSPASAAVTVTIDTAAPATPAGLALLGADDSGVIGDGITSHAQPAITGTGTAGDTVTLAEGGITIGTGIVGAGGGFTITPDAAFADGAHTVTATLTDVAGNVSAPSAALSLTIVTVAPAAPGAPVLALPDDTGVSDSDGITNVTQPTITGTATPGDTVTVYDGTTAIGTAVVGVDGMYGVVPASPLAEGAHGLTVTQTDLAGNRSDPSAALSVVIDTVRPALTAALILDDGISGTDHVTTSPGITGTTDPNGIVTFTEGGVVLGSAQADGTGLYSFEPVGLAGGSHTIVATGSVPDVAGNVGQAQLGLVLAGVIPVAPSVLSLAPASDSGIQGDATTNVTAPVIVGTAAPTFTVTLYDGATVVGTAVARSDGSFAITPAQPLTDGAHSFTATQTDPTNLTSPPTVAFSLTIDTAAPAAPSALVLAPQSDGGVLGDDLTDVARPVITGTGVAGSGVTLFDGTTAIGTGTVGGDGTFSIVPTTPLADGLHALTARQADPAGNLSDAGPVLALTIDTAIPATPTLALAAASDSGALGDGLTNVASPTLTGTGTAGDTVTLLDSASPLGTAVVGADGTWSITVATVLADGPHALSARESGPGGALSAASTVLPLTIDAAPVAAPGNLALAPASDTGVVGDGITATVRPVVTGTGLAGQTVLLFDGAAPSPIGSATVAGDGTWAITPVAALGAGTHGLTAVLVNAAGTRSVASTVLPLTINSTAVSSTSFVLPIDTDQTISVGITAPTSPQYTAGQLAISVTGLPTDGTVTLADGTAVAVGQSLTGGELTGLLFTPQKGTAPATSYFTYQVVDPANLVNTGRVEFSIGQGTPQITTGGKIPNTPTPTIEGTALPNTPVTLLANGVAIGSTTSDPVTGAYSVVASQPLGLGLNRLVTTTVLPGGTISASAPLIVFDVQAPEAGISTTDFSSADIGNALGLGAKLAFVADTQAVELTDATLSVGTETQEATIQRLYVGLLDRGNDTGGISFYDQQLIDGSSRTLVAQEILDSPEFVALHGIQSDADFVGTLYQGLLGRPAATDPGSGSWVDKLAEGTSRADVALGVADSSEAKANLAAATARVFVPHDAGRLGHVLFETGLGREIELSTLADYKVEFKTLTMAQLAENVSNSPEFAALHVGQDNAQYVQSLYQAGLGRAADPDGLSFFVGELANGVQTRGSVLLQIATSDEAARHLTFHLGA